MVGELVRIDGIQGALQLVRMFLQVFACRHLQPLSIQDPCGMAPFDQGMQESFHPLHAGSADLPEVCRKRADP
eukprot:10881348-Alexandrium_andersonii.AAC.1